MTSRRRLISGLLFASALVLPVAQGCGGDDASVGANPVGDGGGDESIATPGSDGSTPTGDGSTPLGDSAPSLDAFCTAYSAYETRCALTDACDVARLAACTTDESISAAGAITAYEACATQEPCPGVAPSADGGLKAYDECLAAHYGTPTATAKMVVGDYCARCPSGGPGACDTGPVAQELLKYDDAILTEIDTKCIDRDGGADDAGGGSVGGKCANFDKCSTDVIRAHDPAPASCGDQ
jgi:hypothetical protein